ncbi:MAG: KTSC domain-containing protein [Clostridium celatum]|nr:KTSC domain-containing protein [Clostridium celatum]
MIMKEVSSSRMSKVGWENNTLYVQFKNGVVYAYENISENEYINFISSPSLGSELSKLDKCHNYYIL